MDKNIYCEDIDMLYLPELDDCNSQFSSCKLSADNEIVLDLQRWNEGIDSTRSLNV